MLLFSLNVYTKIWDCVNALYSSHYGYGNRVIALWLMVMLGLT